MPTLSWRLLWFPYPKRSKYCGHIWLFWRQGLASFIHHSSRRNPSILLWGCTGSWWDCNSKCPTLADEGVQLWHSPGGSEALPRLSPNSITLQCDSWIKQTWNTTAGAHSCHEEPLFILLKDTCSCSAPVLATVGFFDQSWFYEGLCVLQVNSCKITHCRFLLFATKDTEWWSFLLPNPHNTSPVHFSGPLTVLLCIIIIHVILFFVLRNSNSRILYWRSHHSGRTKV